MKISSILLLVLLTGCTTLPVERNFPPYPDLGSCPMLQIAPNDATISEFMTVVTKNYTEYYKCAAVVEGWGQWYKDQKKIFQEVGK